MKVYWYILYSLLSVVVTTSAFAVEYRWSFAMGAGTESAQIDNRLGSQLIITCRSASGFNIPTLDLYSKIAAKRSDLNVQFVIDEKNYPVSFSKGMAEPGGRLSQNAIANFVTALNDAKSISFTAEYPDINKKESFSTLNVRDAVGAIVDACLNVPPEKDESANVAAAAATDYERIATLPCTSYLASYQHARLWKLFRTIEEYMRERGVPGNSCNQYDAVTCECRLHETETLGSAVARLIAASQRGFFPSVPICGATADPKVSRDNEAFSSWIRHQGARPRLGLDGQFACDYLAFSTPKGPRRAEVPLRKGRDVTCRGTLINTDKEGGDTAKIGPCSFVVGDFRIIGTCHYGRPCTVRARVVGDTITHVYSAQEGR